MPSETASKKALDLHREMFRRRLLEVALRRRKNQREKVERVRTPPSASPSTTPRAQPHAERHEEE
jgi:hypothetical protein